MIETKPNLFNRIYAHFYALATGYLLSFLVIISIFYIINYDTANHFFYLFEKLKELRLQYRILIVSGIFLISIIPAYFLDKKIFTKYIKGKTWIFDGGSIYSPGINRKITYDDIKKVFLGIKSRYRILNKIIKIFVPGFYRDTVIIFLESIKLLALNIHQNKNEKEFHSAVTDWLSRKIEKPSAPYYNRVLFFGITPKLNKIVTIKSNRD